eukprot:scaffold79468_cov100-Phaeocystis_antarctica.AAC.1
MFSSDFINKRVLPALTSPKPQDKFRIHCVRPNAGRVAQRSCAALHPVTHTRHGRNALTPTFS